MFFPWLSKARQASSPLVSGAKARIASQIEELLKQQAALETGRKMLWLRLHRRNADGRVRGEQERRRTVIHDYLTGNQPATAAEIAEATEIPIGSVHKLLKDAWFVRSADGWNIAITGRARGSEGN